MYSAHPVTYTCASIYRVGCHYSSFLKHPKRGKHGRAPFPEGLPPTTRKKFQFTDPPDANATVDLGVGKSLIHPEYTSDEDSEEEPTVKNSNNSDLDNLSANTLINNSRNNSVKLSANTLIDNSGNNSVNLSANTLIDNSGNNSVNLSANTLIDNSGNNSVNLNANTLNDNSENNSVIEQDKVEGDLPVQNPIDPNLVNQIHQEGLENINNMALAANQNISLNDALTFVPRFDGVSSELTDFLNSCNDAKSVLLNAAESNLTKLIYGSKLSSKVRASLNSEIPASVAILTTALKKIYVPSKTLFQLQGELGTIYQLDNESVVDFANKSRIFFSVWKLSSLVLLYHHM
uniref:Uncharacterized protein n=1 Tax=Cotesia congregata TaxID=51543 RepID=S6CVN9_COTCN|nr:hypothetical protein CcPL2.059 [Cotesia congregata]